MCAERIKRTHKRQESFERENYEPATFTELRPADGRLIAKRVHKDGRIEQAPRCSAWNHRLIYIHNCRYLYEYLSNHRDGRVCRISGIAATDRQPLHAWYAFRTHHGVDVGDRGFMANDTCLITLDIDGVTTTIDWRRDPEGAVREVVARLPEPWCDASYVWMFSATHGLLMKSNKWTGRIGGDVLRLRLYFLAEKKLDHKTTTLWVSTLVEMLPGIDLKAAFPVRLDYIARPLWIGHAGRDPLGNIQTIGLVHGRHERLTVPDELRELVRLRVRGGGGSLIGHPDVRTAINCIGMPEVGGKGDGVLRVHVMDAVRHLVRDNPLPKRTDIEAHAHDIRNDLIKRVRGVWGRVLRNMQTFGRGSDTALLDAYLDDAWRMALWFLEHAPRTRGSECSYVRPEYWYDVVDEDVEKQRAAVNLMTLPKPYKRFYELPAGVGVGKTYAMRGMAKRTIERQDEEQTNGNILWSASRFKR
jgi:hypothetical protein